MVSSSAVVSGSLRSMSRDPRPRNEGSPQGRCQPTGVVRGGEAGGPFEALEGEDDLAAASPTLQGHEQRARLPTGSGARLCSLTHDDLEDAAAAVDVADLADPVAGLEQPAERLRWRGGRVGDVGGDVGARAPAAWRFARLSTV